MASSFHILSANRQSPCTYVSASATTKKWKSKINQARTFHSMVRQQRTVRYVLDCEPNWGHFVSLTRFTSKLVNVENMNLQRANHEST